jgi:hypothetical protein
MMSSASDARRIAAGSLPSEFVLRTHAVNQSGGGSGPEGQAKALFDPLRLCIFATIALLGWVAGPLALSVFAAAGVIGYWKARRQGLRKSKCFLRDTRLVLAYLGILLALGLYGIYGLAKELFSF